MKYIYNRIYTCLSSKAKSEFLQVVLRFQFDENKINKIYDFFLKEGFIAGFVFDESYINEQSKSFLGTDKSIKGKGIITDEYGQKWKDISKNYGRRTITKDYIYHGASKMWFGSEFFQIFSKEKLISFKGAKKIIELENDIVFVHLYDGIFDGDKNRKIQKTFREFLEIDKREISL